MQHGRGIFFSRTSVLKRMQRWFFVECGRYGLRVIKGVTVNCQSRYGVLWNGHETRCLVYGGSCIPQKQQKEEVCDRWKKSPDGWYKCNADGALSTADNTEAVGVVLRDHGGRFLAGRAAWNARCADALFMEALACRKGLLQVKQCGVAKVCLETDCLGLVKLWSTLMNSDRQSTWSFVTFRIWVGALMSFPLFMQIELVIGWLVSVLDMSRTS